jgi:hypothetical protein
MAERSGACTRDLDWEVPASHAGWFVTTTTRKPASLASRTASIARIQAEAETWLTYPTSWEKRSVAIDEDGRPPAGAHTAAPVRLLASLSVPRFLARAR